MPSTVINRPITATSKPLPAAARRPLRWWPALGVVWAFYVAQAWSPLRLNFDSIVLLSMADAAARGEGFTFHGRTTQFPPGYPFLIAVLDWCGLAGPWSIVALNTAFLAAGVAALAWTLRRTLDMPRWLISILCGMFLLSYLSVKHVTLPLSDVPFFGVCMCSLALMTACEGGSRRFWGLLLAAAAGAVAAIEIRTVGVALLPPLVWVIVRRFTGNGARRRIKVAIAAGLAVAAVVMIVAITRTTYFKETIHNYRTESGESSYVAVVSANLLMRLVEAGEAAVNIPASKAPAAIHRLLPYIGAAFVALCLAGLVLSRAASTPAGVFLLSYLGILFAYVGYDARYWLPALPLVFSFAAAASMRIYGLRTAGRVYGVWIALSGAAALAYSTHISFAGSRFPDVYGDGALRDTYKVAMGQAVPGPGVEVNPNALALLRKYGKARNR